jgi:hypothetical protein
MKVNLICALYFAWVPLYLHILVGGLVAAMCTLMLTVVLEGPRLVTERLEQSKVGEMLFTFRGRYVMDLIIALFLFAMTPWGIFLGASTLLLIFGIRFLGVKQPDAFNEIFRQSELDGEDSYTLEGSEYDAPIGV